MYKKNLNLSDKTIKKIRDVARAQFFESYDKNKITHARVIDIYKCDYYNCYNVIINFDYLHANKTDRNQRELIRIYEDEINNQ